MDEDIVIKVDSLSKKFALNLKRGLFYGTVDLAKSFVGIKPNRENLRKGEFWALDNINFELKKGETLGIIGPNGSGKSTLLRMLTGIFPPDKGKITVKGRVGALIAVGAGFHPHMTGRENIYLNGVILGMSRSEIASKFDEIVEFAEIGDFLEAPVSTYSSGMKVRLGFSIAIHSDTDILLVDEVLSVGDANFRNKSLKKIQGIMKASKGIIFISHNLDQILYLCQRVIVMEKGVIKFEGQTDKAIQYYEENIFSESKFNDKLNSASYNLGVNIDKIKINGQDHTNEIPHVSFKDPLIIETILDIDKELPNSAVIFSITDSNGQPVWVIYPKEFGFDLVNFEKGKYKVRLEVPPMYYKAGDYHLNFVVRNLKSYETYERQTRIAKFKITSTARQRVEIQLTPTPIDYKIEKID